MSTTNAKKMPAVDGLEVILPEYNRPQYRNVDWENPGVSGAGTVASCARSPCG